MQGIRLLGRAKFLPLGDARQNLGAANTSKSFK